MTDVTWDDETAAFYEEEYDFTPPDWSSDPARLLDQHGKPPPIVLNSMQIRMLHAMTRGDPIVAARAGWGSGKTTGLVLLLRWACILYPGTRCMIVTDSRPRYVKVLHPAIQEWCPTWQWFARDCYWYDPRSKTKIYVVWYYRPSTRTSDQNPIEGVDVSGIAIVDECQALPAEVGAKLVGRVRSGPTTTRVYVGLPVEPAWWVDAAVKVGCQPHFFPSSVNAKNHAEGWLEQAYEELDEDEAASMLDGRPVPRKGQVLHNWRWEQWPEGNLTPNWWRYDPEGMKGYVAIDPGSNKPSAVIIVEDWDARWDGGVGRAERPAYVVVAEINLKRLSIDEFTEAILEVAWPRAQRTEAPGSRYWLDQGVIDRAGKQVRFSDKRNAAMDFEQAAKLGPDGESLGGVGVYLYTEEDKAKVGSVSAGLRPLRKLISHRGVRRLLCTQEVYEAGRRKGSGGNNLVRAIAEYRYRQGSDSSIEEPLKSGVEDPIDCLRYFVIWREWYDSPLVTSAVHRKRTASKTKHRKTPQHSSQARWSARRDKGRR